MNKRSGVTFGCCYWQYRGQENKLFVLFAGVSILVQVECRAGLCIAVSARPCGPGTISNEQPTQAELTGPVTEVRTPGTEVVVGYGTAAWLVRQGIPDIFWPDGHQQEHGASTQRLLHLFRHHPQGTV
ncbi:hypothetical protein LPB39_07925 [Salmonella enterica subsp. enterica]|uniref:hypothetical protein n=1 Tax=Salmonella enterica TaxID=28901 RepID=UPI00352A565C